jgi:uncharacterized membrane protein YeiH
MNALWHYTLEHFGVAVAAVTGVLAARGKRVDLFGVMVLAVVTALGGGTIRDLSLGALPVFWVRDPHYLITALGTAGAVFFVARSHRFPSPVLEVADAFVLSFFTMVGLMRALALGSTPLIGVAMGVVTGVVGGILRDRLLGEMPLVFRPEVYLYATASILGALAYVGVLQAGFPPYQALWTGLLITLLLRLAGIRWRISLPVFTPVDDQPPVEP